MVDGPITLGDLAAKLGLTRSTAHRLASALTDRRYLTFMPRQGYQLGPKLLELGFRAQRQTDLVQTRVPTLSRSRASTGDTVHLGVMESDRALYLDKIPGRRRIEISSRVGDRHPLTSTGLGKALLLDEETDRWRALFAKDQASGSPAAKYGIWLERMKDYVRSGYAFDLEENEDLIPLCRGADPRRQRRYRRRDERFERGAVHGRRAHARAVGRGARHRDGDQP